MSIRAGFTVEEIRELVFEYEVLVHGQKVSWLAARGLSYNTLSRWRSAVFGGDLDRGLVPREAGGMTGSAEERAAVVHQRREAKREAERAEHEAQVAALTARVRELEETNQALGKAIGLLHALNEQEPAEHQG